MPQTLRSRTHYILPPAEPQGPNEGAPGSANGEAAPPSGHSFALSVTSLKTDNRRDLKYLRGRKGFPPPRPNRVLSGRSARSFPGKKPPTPESKPGTEFQRETGCPSLPGTCVPHRARPPHETAFFCHAPTWMPPPQVGPRAAELPPFGPFSILSQPGPPFSSVVEIL